MRSRGLAASDCACRGGRPAGEKLVVYPVDRTAVNVGTRRWSLAPRGVGKAQRRLMLPGGGGASVVVRGAPRGAMRKEMKDDIYLIRAGWNAGSGLVQRPGEAGDG